MDAFIVPPLVDPPAIDTVVKDLQGLIRTEYIMDNKYNMDTIIMARDEVSGRLKTKNQLKNSKDETADFSRLPNEKEYPVQRCAVPRSLGIAQPK